MSRAQPQFSKLLMPGFHAEVLALLAAAERVDGVAPVGERALGAAGGPHLLATIDGAIAGYAHVETDVRSTVELAVHPAHRRAGVGGALVRTVTDRVGVGARFWAHGDLPAARALAAATGMAGVRDLWQLRLDFAGTELPDVATPAGIRLSTYCAPDDDAELLAVNHAAFAWHPEQGDLDAADLAELQAQDWFDPAGLFLARDESTGALLGFHWTKVHFGGSDLGEVYVLGMAPAAQGRGLGRYLTLVGLHHLRARGLGTVLLYVEGDNTAALHTYERIGFARYHLDRLYAHSDAAVGTATKSS